MTAPAPFLRERRGGDVPLFSPEPRHISLEAIAWRLAHLNRFTGDADPPVSVAQHSLAVAHVLRRDRAPIAVQLAGLLHDGHEAYLGEISRPVALALFWHCPRPTPLDLARQAFDDAIFTALGVPMAARYDPRIAIADDQVLAAEWRACMRGPCPIDAAPAAGVPMSFIPPMKAIERFLATYGQLRAAL